jgi:hypothetical protein
MHAKPCGWIWLGLWRTVNVTVVRYAWAARILHRIICHPSLGLDVNISQDVWAMHVNYSKSLHPPHGTESLQIVKVKFERLRQ